ncbi:helix-turn-helix domain-containing protein [Caballeronia glathei]|uniref:Transcriptional regulator n=1 Tax=Caballeronia glathei TaxID=60547 RepID=A0A069PIR7_9BURK|nr:helix-turn-helix domain-containing protein [Caballeronia glathei]KDR40495.1 transcriptional regulator [Caballeronia glathei]
MNKTYIGTGTEADFFARGKRIAQKVDRGEPLMETRILTFEDPADVAQLLTQARIGLFRAIKAEPASITSIAARLHRDRSAVKRDVDALLAAGLVSVETTVNAGHGTHKVVRAVASRVDLHVMID